MSNHFCKSEVFVATLLKIRMTDWQINNNNNNDNNNNNEQFLGNHAKYDNKKIF